MLRPRPAHRPTLRRKPTLPVWVSIAWRVGLVLGLVALAIAVHWIDRAGLRDNYDGEVSFTDVIYFTMISITTTGYGDIAPVSDRARLFDALIVTPIRVFIILIFVGTAYSFVIRRIWDKWRMAHIQRTLTDHIIVAGFGAGGEQVVRELIARATDTGRIVVIDQDETAIGRAEQLGCIVLQADATRDGALTDAAIERACSLVVTAGRDDTAILITLTARHLAPGVRISIAVRAEDNELLARQAGANVVINPVGFAGLLLAGSCEGSHLADYLADLASASGQVRLVERRATDADVGRSMRDLEGLPVRLYRDDRGLGSDAAVAAGDTIIEIRDTVPNT